MRLLPLLVLLSGCGSPSLSESEAALARSDLVRTCMNGDIVGLDPLTHRYVLARPATFSYSSLTALVAPGTPLRDICS